jgi:hypothetical protein
MSRRPASLGRPARTIAAVAAAVTAGLALTPPASAVQTDTFALSLRSGAPGVVLAAGSKVNADLLASNRSTKPVTVTLDRVAVTRDAAGTISYGASQQGLARSLTLGSTTVTLAPHATATVPMTVSAPGEAVGQWAAVTATVDDGTASGVRSRLAVLVRVTARPAGVVEAYAGPVGIALAILIAMALGTALAWRRRSRMLA